MIRMFHDKFIKKFSLCMIIFSQFVVCSSPEHYDPVYNGFTQFLGSLYQYESKTLAGGQMNAIQLCTVNDKKYVVRIMNAPLSKCRGEILAQVSMAAKKIAPHIHYYDQDNYSLVIMDYIDAKTLSWQQARDPYVLKKMAEKIRLIEACDQDMFVDNKKMDVFNYIVCCYEKIKTRQCAIDNAIFDEAFHKAEILYHAIESRNPRLVLSHNDLHPRNIFFIDNDISIIDWEIIGLNYEFFDLALYSLYSCLRDEDEYLLLTYYLERDPSDQQLQYFKDIKLLISVFGAFWNFAFSDDIPHDISLDMVKDFDYYGKVFTETNDADSTRFWFAFSASLLQKFFKDYERFEKEQL